MTDYRPPICDIRFVLERVLGFNRHPGLARFHVLDDDLVGAILEEAGSFAAGVIAPLNAVGDQAGCRWSADGSVTTPPGFVEAYRRYVEAGWGTLALPEELGGQGLPHVLATAVEEFMNSACQAFTMYPGLTHGAVDALRAAGSESLKAEYLPRLASGEWLGTMALTEPHCGTDLGLIATRAEPAPGGSFRISGEKIFCSGGEQDLTDNIIHLVLGRLPDAPAGSRGTSLFLVPKLLADGTRNAVTCTGIEHKMGLKGSATCAMSFAGATGWLVGEPNGGLAAMFVMMNAARLTCGNHGLAAAELAYQRASSYARERRQGRAPGMQPSGRSADPIIVHPDVRRMLMDARATTEGLRALIAWTALQIDVARHDRRVDERQWAAAVVGLLTPVIKAHGTDQGFATAVAMQQVLGGHGYIAEWGMEQIVRDARVAMIYEGANGVQALDLAQRKVAKDGGQVAELLFAMIERECAGAETELAFIAEPLADAIGEMREAAAMLVRADPEELGAASYPFLQMLGISAIGWMWLRMAAASIEERDDPFCAAKLVTARHYALRFLPDVAALRRKVEAGAGTLMALPAEAFGAG